ncbi:MAG: response regulator [Verrucomicrobia bacterium]|nr:response regulator [Verrucomicrobiota bacterium]
MAYNILIVDDSLTARTFIARTLQMAELPLSQVYQARNGQEALGLLEREWVDLVFADINMPDMDGVELVRRMRATELLKSVPVVIVSTDRSERRMAEMNEAGVQAYLTKPVTPEDLKATVERLLKSA